MGRRRRRKDERLRFERTIGALRDIVDGDRDKITKLTAALDRGRLRAAPVVAIAFAVGLLIGWLLP